MWLETACGGKDALGGGDALRAWVKRQPDLQNDVVVRARANKEPVRRDVRGTFVGGGTSGSSVKAYDKRRVRAEDLGC